MAAANEQSDLRYAWYVVVVLMACYTLSFVDRQILSLLVGPIKRDLTISDTRVGLLQGLAFSLFYTLMGLPLGRLADTRNRRNFIGASVALWSLFTSACSAAKSFWWLFLTRIGVGVGEAGLSPAAYSMISDYFPKQHLGVAMGLYSMGVFIGSSLALLVGGTTIDLLQRTPEVAMPFLGTMASWRLTFLVVGAPGLLFALWVFTIREPLRRNLLRKAAGQPARLTLSGTVAQIRPRLQSVAGISVAMIFQAMCTFAFLAWAPTFFIRIHGWTPGQAGRALGLIVLIFGCSGMYFGGHLCDRWQRQGKCQAPLMVAALSVIGTGVFFPLAMMAPRPGWTLALACPAVFCLAPPVATAVAALQLIFPNQVRGQVVALYLLILNLGGQGLGPLLPAVFDDYIFKNEKMIGPSLALTIGIASFLALIVFAATFRPYKTHYLTMHAVS